jgi:hypothetical protein
MDFINEKIDTMAFNDIESMKYVVIEKDTFYRVQKSSVQQIANRSSYFFDSGLEM